LLPEAEVAIGRIKSEIQIPPKNIQSFFIPKLNQDEILSLPKTTKKDVKQKKQTKSN